MNTEHLSHQFRAWAHVVDKLRAVLEHGTGDALAIEIAMDLADQMRDVAARLEVRDASRPADR